MKAAALSMVIALPLGALLGIARLSDHRWVRVPAGAVVEFFRSIPVLLLMLFAAAFYVSSTDISSEDRPLYAVVTGLVLYNASVLAEIVRAGILSLPRGQTEAAFAVGLRKGQTMTNVLLPQAVTVMLPAIVSQLVVIVKDTALGGVMLSFTELLNARSTLAANYANVIPSFIVVAVDLHRDQLPHHHLRQLAGGPTATRQEVDRCGARPGDGGRHGGDRRGRHHLTDAQLVCPARRQRCDRHGGSGAFATASVALPRHPRTCRTRGNVERVGAGACGASSLTGWRGICCIRFVIVHPAPPSCSLVSMKTSLWAGGAAPWTR